MVKFQSEKTLSEQKHEFKFESTKTSDIKLKFKLFKI